MSSDYTDILLIKNGGKYFFATAPAWSGISVGDIVEVEGRFDQFDVEAVLTLSNNYDNKTKKFIDAICDGDYKKVSMIYGRRPVEWKESEGSEDE